MRVAGDMQEEPHPPIENSIFFDQSEGALKYAPPPRQQQP